MLAKIFEVGIHFLMNC